MLYDVYTRLVHEFPSACSYLYGNVISESHGIWFSVDEHAFPCLLFKSRGNVECYDIELKFIDVEFSRECEIALDGQEPLSGSYTIVRLNENDPDIVRIFLRLLEEAFCQDHKNYSNSEISEKIRDLADLFSRIDKAKSDIIGLWGELYFILKSHSIANAVQCWCLHKNAKYDFVGDHFAIEVKTTLKPKRIHRFV